ncbi:aminotransferase class I/II-fold pyridoxal phosphate-dependent enzyme [Nesterenkonia pannonica]|uniref:MalY/PatB family protein n=1 Tax=Nesterenkonia pannonica TaxID=1548602 RepID=UPI002164E6BE|nr:aminotransferase class I/II-fold pyridoxal phosphate-dependent enzyme [Nesterenkonia pannonica]
MGQTAESPDNPLEQLSLEQLRHRRSAKWRVFGDDVLPLWVAEQDTLLAEPVAEALRRAVEIGDTGYPTTAPFVEAFCGFAAQRWGWEVSASQVRPVRDVMSGVVNALHLITELADTVIVNSPVYPPFFKYPSSGGLRVVEAPLGADGRIDFEMLEESFNLRTSGGSAAMLLCNPQNPTGVVHTREELEQVAELAHSYGVRVVADEIHAPLVYDEHSFTPYLTVDPAGLSLMSASKAWNLAGAKAGLLLVSDDAVGELQNLPSEIAYGPSHLGVLAQTAAYSEGGPWLDSLLTGLDSNRRLLSELLQKHAPQVGHTMPEGTYLAWLDFSAYGFETDEPTGGTESPIQGPARHLLAEAGVALSGGHGFGTGGERHARLNFACSQSTLTEAAERIGRALG